MKHLIPFFVLLLLLSCSEERFSQENNDSSLNLPVLSFKNSEEMLGYATNANKNTSSGRQNSKNPQFQSFDLIYKKAIEELANAQSSDEVAGLLKTYSDFVLVSDSTFFPKMANSFYRAICNAERIYESEGLLHKVIDDQFIVIAKKENLKGLRQITSSSNLDLSIYKLVQYTDSKIDSRGGRTLSDACSNNMEYYILDDVSGCKNDRRAHVRANLSWAISGNYYTPMLIAEIWGTRKAGVFCYWKSYPTILHSRNAYFDVKIAINGGIWHFVLTTTDIPNYDGTSEEEDPHTVYYHSVTGAILWQGGATPALSFTRAFLEASTRGTGDSNWVSIDCVGPN